MHSVSIETQRAVWSVVQAAVRKQVALSCLDRFAETTNNHTDNISHWFNPAFPTGGRLVRVIRTGFSEDMGVMWPGNPYRGTAGVQA